MLNLSLPGRVFLCTLPTDMRKSFDTLAGLVEQQLGQDPLAGDLFVFRSKRGDRLKLLYWDTDGLAIWYKKQEEECPHCFAFTEFGERAHNRSFGLTRAIAVAPNSPSRASRRSPMSQASTTVAPPRAHRPRWFSISFGIG
jgi:hypothetical protein